MEVVITIGANTTDEIKEKLKQIAENIECDKEEIYFHVERRWVYRSDKDPQFTKVLVRP